MESGTLLILIVVWFILAAVVGSMGSDRKIGFGPIFALSLLATPIIAALVALGSERKLKDSELDQDSQRRFNEATQRAKQKRHDEAIVILHEVLSLKPNYAAAHFNLACNYSRLSKKDEAFNSLAAAVKCGYANFQKIQSDPDLAFLRSQPEFSQFAASGYRETPKSSSADETINKLERLAALKSQGVLTDQEFIEQKARILKGN
jgi:tetratricopeptide (TPR) repeat protein